MIVHQIGDVKLVKEGKYFALRSKDNEQFFGEDFFGAVMTMQEMEIQSIPITKMFQPRTKKKSLLGGLF